MYNKISVWEKNLYLYIHNKHFKLYIKMAEIKFTEEELGKINNLRQQIGQSFAQIGQLHLEKKRRVQEVETELGLVEANYNKLVVDEQELFTTLNKKYGDGNFDPQTGVFTPSEEKTTELVGSEK